MNVYVGCQYMCFFLRWLRFFHSIRLHFYIPPFAILFAQIDRHVSVDKCEQEMKVHSTFLRGISECERQKSVKRKIEGSTSPHPSNKHVTNTLTLFIGLLWAPTHRSLFMKKRGLKFFCLCDGIACLCWF